MVSSSFASSLRDAPYVGMFLVFYEAIKHDAASILPPPSPLGDMALNSGSAAAAGTFATRFTQNLDCAPSPKMPNYRTYATVS